MPDIEFWLITLGVLILGIVLPQLLSRLRVSRQEAALMKSYTLREAVLTAAEQKFLAALKPVVGERFTIFAMVRLADLVETKNLNRSTYFSALGKVTQKHIDFLLCQPDTFSPFLAIELDDRSHQRRDRRERDEFVDELLARVGLPLMRVKVAGSYAPETLKQQIVDAVRPSRNGERRP
jgi:very-short-patch-repair endonuclease